MKKHTIFPYVYLILCSLALCGKIAAQSSLNLGVNVSTGVKGFLPDGKRGLGGNLVYVHQVWKQGGIRLSAGYEWFDYRKSKSIPEQVWRDMMLQYPGRYEDITLIPVRAGIQQSILQGKISLFAEAGIARIKPALDNGHAVFSFAFGSGLYRLPVKKDQYLQLSVAYNYNGSYKWKGLRPFPHHNYISFTLSYGFQFRHK